MTTWAALDGETPIDPSKLRDRASITNRTELAAAEARNIARPFLKYLSVKPTRRIAPFDFDWLTRLHEEMFEDVWTWAGKIRSHDLNLGAPHHQVREQLVALAQDASVWKAPFPLLDQSVRLHHRAVQIHPFENGNGRWARLLANIWLKLHGASVVAWPDSVIGRRSEVRDEYLDAIRAADEGRSRPLADMHRRFQENLHP